MRGTVNVHQHGFGAPERARAMPSAIFGNKLEDGLFIDVGELI